MQLDIYFSPFHLAEPYQSTFVTTLVKLFQSLNMLPSVGRLGYLVCLNEEYREFTNFEPMF